MVSDAKSKQSKRGGKRERAGRKSKAEKAAALVADGVLSEPKSEPDEPVKTGRPTDYKPVFATQAEKLCRLGATDIELADFFGCDVRSIYRWAQSHDAFCQSLRTGKDACDERVERSLYNRAIGYTFDAVKIFMPANAAAPVYAKYQEHVPPDVTAASKWLNNRRPEKWREKQEVIHSGAIGRAGDLSDSDLADIATGRSEGTNPPPSSQNGSGSVH